jgi:hypothetical protein
MNPTRLHLAKIQRYVWAVCAVIVVTIAPVQRAASVELTELASWRESAREASAIYDVPLVALTLLYEMEGGRLGAETPNRNKDGEITSYDMARCWGSCIA